MSIEKSFYYKVVHKDSQNQISEDTCIRIFQRGKGRVEMVNDTVKKVLPLNGVLPTRIDELMN